MFLHDVLDATKMSALAGFKVNVLRDKAKLGVVGDYLISHEGLHVWQFLLHAIGELLVACANDVEDFFGLLIFFLLFGRLQP